MQATLWVALGSKSTYELAPSRQSSERSILLHLEREFRLDESIPDPPFLALFICPDPLRASQPSVPPPPPASSGKIQVAKQSMLTPTPKSGRENIFANPENVMASVKKLASLGSRKVQFDLKATRGSLSSIKDWELYLTSLDSKLEARVIKPLR